MLYRKIQNDANINTVSLFLINGAIVVVFIGILCTVFAIDSSLPQKSITAKYFWFAASVCFASLLLPFKLSKRNEIHIVDVLFCALALYVCCNYFFLNGNPNMQWWLTLLMLPLYFSIRSISGNENIRRCLHVSILVVVLIQAIWGLLQLYGLVSSYHSAYKLTGSFFNPGPYSGFVVAGIPLALCYSFNKTLVRWERWLGIATLLAVLLVLPAAMSRAAWIAAAVGCMPVLFKYFGFSFSNLQHKLPIVVAVSLITVALVLGTYVIKKDSADGRFLIWSASMQSVRENTFFGAGYGRFAAVYGDAQAAYFEKTQRTAEQLMVADSPENAFNEYVKITVELGIVGLALFIMLIGSCFFNFRSLTANHYALIAILVFAAFSYPFSVLPLSIIFIFLLAFSAPMSKKLSFSLPIWLQIIGVVVCIGITSHSAYNVLPKRAAYKEWASIRALYRVNAHNYVLEKYTSLYPRLYFDKNFLFEYAQSLYSAGQYAESNLIFDKYLLYGSDPMVYNCIGNNFKEMGDYAKAENMYIRASQIVPNRHYPLYLLMKLYAEIDEAEKAKAMAETLLNKPVKIQSTAIREMQMEAKRIISN